jgi:hypothetical protein
VSGPNSAERKRQPSVPSDNGGVLANLPRTRPQRSSPRRAAARTAATKPTTQAANGTRETAAKTKKAPPRPRRPSARKAQAGKPATGRSTAKPSARASRREAELHSDRERVPAQGFECASESVSGPVQPPGGPELVASAVEIVGELAKAGLSSGERVLRDVFSRLPLP